MDVLLWDADEFDYALAQGGVKQFVMDKRLAAIRYALTDYHIKSPVRP